MERDSHCFQATSLNTRLNMDRYDQEELYPGDLQFNINTPIAICGVNYSLDPRPFLVWRSKIMVEK